MIALIVGILATWRITSVLSRERGPFAIGTQLRRLFGVHHAPDGSPAYAVDGEILLNPVTSSAHIDAVLHEFAQGIICMWCCSVWVGLLVALVITPLVDVPYLLVALALSGGTILVERVSE